MIGWILSGLSITGAIFCIFKSPWAWIIWLVGNTGWFLIKIIEHDYAQATMWVIYQGVCLVGLYRWQKEKTNEG